MRPDFFSLLKSSVKGINWPPVHDPYGAAILSLLYQLDESQWLPQDRILELQFRQLGGLLSHAVRTVPYYRGLSGKELTDPGKFLTLSEWQNIPVLTRRNIQEAGNLLLSNDIPPQHKPLHKMQSSGSTGIPIESIATAVTGLFWDTIAIRDHLWHKRDFSFKMAAIRHCPPGKAEWPGDSFQNWGQGIGQFLTTGPVVLLNSNTDLSKQAEWLKWENPDSLLTYPSNLEALARHFIKSGGTLPKLREVRSFGEAISPELRTVCKSAWGVPLVDMYSSQEAGYIALQCPDEHENYHIQSESIFIEILNEAGNQCGPGEIGKVVVSTLHNFAMPLIRYELGDYAEAGALCPCGRGLPTLKRIMGRVRNMITLPSGEKRWPRHGILQSVKAFSIRQFQMVQHSLDEVELRLVADHRLSKSGEEQLRKKITDALGAPFRITFTYLADIPRGTGGKFEDFISEVN